MTRSRISHSLQRFRRSEDGASLVEYAVVITLFLLLFFGILDMGRLGFNWVMTEKAMQRAARIAVARPPICTGVPTIHQRGSDLSEPMGTPCRESAGMCAVEDLVACTFNVSETLRGFNGDNGYRDDCESIGNADTATEIWCTIWPILPNTATPRHLRVTYAHDPLLGFMGGPYTPMVEMGVVTAADVENPVFSTDTNSAPQALQFDFITPLPGFVTLLSGGTPSSFQTSDSGALAAIPFPDLSVSMPGEDLAQGNNG